MITDDSRWNFSTKIRVVDNNGNLLENERVDMPTLRTQIVRSKLPDLQDYKVRDGDTWSNIAARFLRGRSDLWWVIAEFTGTIDPFGELVVGAVLQLPSFETVMFDTLTFDTSATPDDTFTGI
jgi:hypothetical protein